MNKSSDFPWVSIFQWFLALSYGEFYIKLQLELHLSILVVGYFFITFWLRCKGQKGVWHTAFHRLCRLALAKHGKKTTTFFQGSLFLKRLCFSNLQSQLLDPFSSWTKPSRSSFYDWQKMDCWAPGSFQHSCKLSEILCNGCETYRALFQFTILPFHSSSPRGKRGGAKETTRFLLQYWPSWKYHARFQMHVVQLPKRMIYYSSSLY